MLASSYNALANEYEIIGLRGLILSFTAQRVVCKRCILYYDKKYRLVYSFLIFFITP